jgi:hypothetical protein
VAVPVDEPLTLATAGALELHVNVVPDRTCPFASLATATALAVRPWSRVTGPEPPSTVSSTTATVGTTGGMASKLAVAVMSKWFALRTRHWVPVPVQLPSPHPRKRLFVPCALNTTSVFWDKL